MKAATVDGRLTGHTSRCRRRFRSGPSVVECHPCHTDSLLAVQPSRPALRTAATSPLTRSVGIVPEVRKYTSEKRPCAGRDSWAALRRPMGQAIGCDFLPVSSGAACRRAGPSTALRFQRCFWDDPKTSVGLTLLCLCSGTPWHRPPRSIVSVRTIGLRHQRSDHCIARSNNCYSQKSHLTCTVRRRGLL